MKYKEQKNTKTGETRWVPIPEKESVGTFIKSAAEATGLPKSLSNIYALGATGVGAAQMALNKPEAAEKSFESALKARQYAGTEGSFDQGLGSGMKTLGKGSLEAGKTALTALGLKAPVSTLVKTAVPSTLVGGTVSKLAGGTFSEGAGAGFGGTPAIIGTGVVAKKVLTPALKKGQEITKKGLDKLNFGKTWGEEAKQIAANSGKKVNPKEILSKAFSNLENTGITGSTKEKAITELQTIAKNAPNNILETLTQRRGSDKMIIRNLFGIPKSGTGKNVAIAAYRSALDDVIKGIPELANLDKKLSIYYKVKDPVVNLISNRLVQAGGLGWGLSKLF